MRKVGWEMELLPPLSLYKIGNLRARLFLLASLTTITRLGRATARIQPASSNHLTIWNSIINIIVTLKKCTTFKGSCKKKLLRLPLASYHIFVAVAEELSCGFVFYPSLQWTIKSRLTLFCKVKLWCITKLVNMFLR